jgi:dienelactone hydrolase
MPKGLQRLAPAVLCLHPTSPLGKAQVCGLGGKPSRFYAHELAERGFVCLAPDYPSFGDYKYDFNAESDLYVSGTMKAIWNNIRSIDLLESLPEVDRDRIGCVGHSLGGHNGLFTAAFDQRIRAVVSSCGFNALAHYYGGDLTGWSSDRYMPRIRSQFGLSPEQMPFDFHEVLAAMSPRPVFVNAPLRDSNFAVSGVRQAVASARQVYEFHGKPERLKVVYPDAEHDFPEDIRQQVYQWLEEQLKR